MSFLSMQTQDDDQRLKTEKLMVVVVLDAISPIQIIMKLNENRILLKVVKCS